jgi:hypothetical protein
VDVSECMFVRLLHMVQRGSELEEEEDIGHGSNLVKIKRGPLPFKALKGKTNHT